MNDLIIAPVPITMVDLIWEKCTSCLELVIAKSPNEISLETIKASLLKGDAMMVTISDGDDIIAVNIVETYTFATGYKILIIPITGGTRMSEWQERFLNLMHIIAKDLDCKELRGLAVRKGWLRYLKKYGWEPVSTIVSCPVEQQ